MRIPDAGKTGTLADDPAQVRSLYPPQLAGREITILRIEAERGVFERDGHPFAFVWVRIAGQAGEHRVMLNREFLIRQVDEFFARYPDQIWEHCTFHKVRPEQGRFLQWRIVDLDELEDQQRLA
jgi:hypothetical protein